MIPYTPYIRTWSSLTFRARVQLAVQTYTALAQQAATAWCRISGESPRRFWPLLHRVLPASESHFITVVEICEVRKLKGIDYLRSQFACWPRIKPGSRTNCPPFPRPFHLVTEKAIKRYYYWREGHSELPITDQEKREAAVERSRLLVVTFMRSNPRVFPTIKSVLKSSGIRAMLSPLYLKATPEYQELVEEAILISPR
jgi:hypothetical protein